MLEKITIVIPTHCRHPYLVRLLEYYKNIEIKILVADSTKIFFPEYKKYGNIRYFHYPDALFSKKMVDVLQYVKTKYTILCADDDFTLPSAILSCVAFLESNLDYASAQGRYVGFFQATQLYFYPLDLYTTGTGYDLNSNHAQDRIKQVMNPYMHLPYSVHRTETLKDFFQIFNSQNIRITLIEVCLTLFAAINGKHRVLPVFYSAREYLVNSSGLLSPKFDKIVVDSKMAAEYERFLTLITAHLSKKTGMSLTEARKHAEEAINGYLNKFLPESEGHHFIEYKIRNAVKLLAPEFMLSFCRNLLTKLRGKPFSARYLKIQIEKTKGIAGYPFFDKKAGKELEIIKSLILKHNLRIRYPA